MDTTTSQPDSELEWDLDPPEDEKPVPRIPICPIIPYYRKYMDLWDIKWLLFHVWNIPFTIGFSVEISKYAVGLDVSLAYVKLGVYLPLWRGTT